MNQTGSSGINLIGGGRGRLLTLSACLTLMGGVSIAQASTQQWSVNGSRAPMVIDNEHDDATLLGGLVGHGLQSVVRLGSMDVSALLAEDAQFDLEPGVPRRIATHRLVPGGFIETTHSGQWEQLNDGTRLWTVNIESDDARALRVHFSRFNIPEGARVLVTDAEGNVEVFEGRGPLSNGAFWTGFVAGDAATVQYQAPNGVEGLPEIEIDAVSHVYRSFHNAAAGDDELLPCEEDVSCQVVDPIARDSVGRAFFEIEGEGFVCSGVLLDDLDALSTKGWFLTADHCFNTQEIANTLVVYWFYQTPDCGEDVPSLTTRPRSFGAQVIDSDPSTDFSFMRLYEDPNDGQGLAGWSTAPPASDVNCIHHPAGAHKHIAIGTLTGAGPDCPEWPSTHYHSTTWTTGITESGSSGAPLFNEFGQVVGQYTGQCFVAEPGCDNPEDFTNIFGRFDVTFTMIEPFLTSDGIDDIYEENDSFAEATPIPDGFHLLEMSDEDDYYLYEIDAPLDLEVIINFNSAKVNLDLYLRDDDGDIIVASEGDGDVESIQQLIPAGTYVIHVNKTSGFAGSYTMALGFFADCNSNGVPDAQEILDGIEFDCNANGVLDSCEIDNEALADCDENGEPDICQYETVLQPNAGLNGDEYGVSIDRNGHLLVVGAPRNDLAGEDAGAVYVYALDDENDPSSWVLVQILTSPNAADGNRFGTAVVLDGMDLLVGAPFNDDLGNNVGKVFVFSFNGGLGDDVFSPNGEITPSVVNDKSRFGFSLAVSDATLIVGAPKDDGPENQTGVAYIYERPIIAGSPWSETARLTVGNTVNGDEFGHSVAIDGDTAIVGGPNAGPINEGAAYIFLRDEGGADNWGRVARVRASDRETGDRFGQDVSLQGDLLAVGANLESDPGLESGAVYVIGRNVGGPEEWGEITRIKPDDLTEGDWFGYAVRFNGDELLVGAPFDDAAGGDTGAVRTFMKDEGGVDNWGEVAAPAAVDPPMGAFIGADIAANGTDVIVGALTWNDTGAVIMIRDGRTGDCNGNGIADACDIASGSSSDVNENGIPDDCEDIPCPADIDGSGAVDVNDLLDLLANWGECDECPADLDANGIVDVDDLLTLLGAWGTCPGQ